MLSPSFKLAVFTGAFLAIGFASADEKKTTETAPDWTKFVTVSEVTVEIVKIDKNGITVKTQGPAQVKPGTGKNPRPMVAPGKAVDTSISFAEGAQIRWSKLPPKLDTNGKKIQHTAEELAALKTPYGIPGYLADRTDLKSGQIVDIILVRPREIAASKATDADLVIKRLTIVGEDPNAKPAEDPKKKKTN